MGEAGKDRALSTMAGDGVAGRVAALERRCRWLLALGLLAFAALAWVVAVLALREYHRPGSSPYVSGERHFLDAVSAPHVITRRLSVTNEQGDVAAEIDERGVRDARMIRGLPPL